MTLGSDRNNIRLARTPWGAEHLFQIRPDSERRGDIDVIHECFERDDYNLAGLRKAFPAPRVIFDVGAHIGCFTVAAKLLWPDAEVYCFEPNRRSFDLLMENTSDFTGVHLFNYALGYRAGNILLEGEGATGGGYLVDHFDSEDDSGEILGDGRVRVQRAYTVAQQYVPVVTLEEVFAQIGEARVDLAKWDCEGGEMDCFANMTRESASRFDLLAGEYHCFGGYESFISVAEDCFPDHAFTNVRDSHVGLFRGVRYGR
jgi:FkbM family methyltransferase